MNKFSIIMAFRRLVIISLFSILAIFQLKSQDLFNDAYKLRNALKKEDYVDFNTILRKYIYRKDTIGVSIISDIYDNNKYLNAYLDAVNNKFKKKLDSIAGSSEKVKEVKRVNEIKLREIDSNLYVLQNSILQLTDQQNGFTNEFSRSLKEFCAFAQKKNTEKKEIPDSILVVVKLNIPFSVNIQSIDSFRKAIFQIVEKTDSLNRINIVNDLNLVLLDSLRDVLYSKDSLVISKDSLQKERDKTYTLTLKSEEELSKISDYLNKLTDTKDKLYPQKRQLLTYVKSQNTSIRDYFKTDNAQQININVQQSSPFQVSMIDAAATLIADRIEDEMNIQFIAHFNKLLKEQSDFRALFPKTFEVFQILDFGKDYGAFNVQLLKEAFYRDLNTLHLNLLNVKKFQQNSSVYESYYWAVITINLAREFKNMNHPSVFFSKFDAEYNPSFAKRKFVFSFCNEVSKSILRPDGHYISRDSIITLMRDDTLRNCFLGLLHRRLVYSGNVKLESVINDPKMMVAFFRTFCKGILSIENEYEKLKSLNRDELSVDQVKVLFDKILGLLEYSACNFALNNENFCEQIKLANISEASFELLKATSQNNYNSIFTNTILLLNYVDSSYTKELMDKGFLKYGTFMVAVASAKNSDDIKSAFSSVTLPAGSYRIKRESLCNISICSFPGLNYSVDKQPFLKDFNKDLQRTSYGFFAPVGVDFSWSFRGRPWVKSMSIFLTALDLGAPVKLRLSNDTAVLPSDLTFKDFLAPGVFMTFGIRNSPVSIILGAESCPNVRSLVAAPNGVTAYRKEDSWRLSVALTLDLPFFNLYNKSR